MSSSFWYLLHALEIVLEDNCSYLCAIPEKLMHPSTHVSSSDNDTSRTQNSVRKYKMTDDCPCPSHVKPFPFWRLFCLYLVVRGKCREKPSMHSVKCHVECSTSQPEGKLNEAWLHPAHCPPCLFTRKLRLTLQDLDFWELSLWRLVEGIVGVWCALLAILLHTTHYKNKTVNLSFVIVCGLSHFLNRLRF